MARSKTNSNVRSNRNKTNTSLLQSINQLKEHRKNNGLYHGYTFMTPKEKCQYNLARGTMVIDNICTNELYDEVLKGFSLDNDEVEEQIDEVNEEET